MALVGICAVTASTAVLGGGGQATVQPAIGVRSRAVLTIDGAQFKDANGSGRRTTCPSPRWRRHGPGR